MDNSSHKKNRQQLKEVKHQQVKTEEIEKLVTQFNDIPPTSWGNVLWKDNPLILKAKYFTT